MKVFQGAEVIWGDAPRPREKLPADQQVRFLHDLVKRLVLSIAEREDEVRVVVYDVPPRVGFTVRVHHSDIGLVLGEKGATVNAIRRIVWTAAKKTDYQVDIDLCG